MKKFTFFFVCSIIPFWIGCSSDPDPDPCQTSPQVTNLAVAEASCGGSNGSIEVKASGGNGTLSFSLNGSAYQQSNKFDNLSTGTYTLRVQDEQSCKIEQQVEVGERNDLLVSINSSTNAGCETAAGAVELQASGGQGNYTFSINGTQFQELASFGNLAAGTYTAHVKDAAGCVQTASFTLLSGISYDATVKAIIKNNCAISGCHVAGTGRANFTEFSQIKRNASTIKSLTQSKAMPPAHSGKSLSAEEIAAIACWVDDGAPQN